MQDNLRHVVIKQQGTPVRNYWNKTSLKQIVAVNAIYHRSDRIPKFTRRIKIKPWSWEIRRPYLYMRTTGDWPFIGGGEDDDIEYPGNDVNKRVDKKAQTFGQESRKLFPKLPNEILRFHGRNFLLKLKMVLPFLGPHKQIRRTGAICHGNTVETVFTYSKWIGAGFNWEQI